MAHPRLTVLQLLPSLEGGGVEQGTLEIAAGLAAAGHRPLVMSAGGRLVAELERSGAEHLRWPIGRKSPFTLSLAWRLRALLQRERVTVVHARSRVPAWIAWLAWRALPAANRPRFVTTVHGFYRVGRYSSVMTRGERVICVSRAIRQYVLSNYGGVKPSDLVVIPRGVDRARFAHGYRPDAGWLEHWHAAHPQLRDGKILLLPGRITRLKGHHDFIHLVARLRAAGVNAHGLVAGGEDPRRAAYAAEVRERIRQAGLEHHVRLLGQRADLREIMAVSDVVLSLSSQPESFGRVALEALSLGRPVMGYDHGGVGELLATLYPCGLVQAGNADALFATASQLLHEPPAVPECHDYVLEHMIARTLALYVQLASEGA